MSPTPTPRVLTAARHDLADYAAHLEPPAAVVREQAMLMLTGGPAADFNMAVFGASEKDAAVLREYISTVRTAGVQALFMWPSALAERLGAVARDEGLLEAGTAPLMLLEDLHAGPASVDAGSFEIQRVEDTGRLAQVADLIASAFGLDRDWVGRTFAAPSLLRCQGVQFWLATRNATPYSTLTCLHAAGPVGIWSMATAPEYQRLGAGRALLEAVLRHHRLIGNDSFYLIATPAGKPLYDALGFATIDELAIWVAGESVQFATHAAS